MSLEDQNREEQAPARVAVPEARTAQQWTTLLRGWKGYLRNTLRRHLRKWKDEHPEHFRADGHSTVEGYNECFKDLFGNPLKFWFKHKDDGPCRDLYRLAATCFSIPATECAAERLFKRMKLIATPSRGRASQERLEQQAVIGLNLEHAGIKSIADMAQLVCEVAPEDEAPEGGE